MFEKFCVLLIFIILKVLNLLILNHCTHNLYVIFAKFHNVSKQFAGNLVNEYGNIPRRFANYSVYGLCV